LSQKTDPIQFNFLGESTDPINLSSILARQILKLTVVLTIYLEKNLKAKKILGEKKLDYASKLANLLYEGNFNTLSIRVMSNSDSNGQHLWPKARVLPITNNHCISYLQYCLLTSKSGNSLNSVFR
jgi:hypothetical protein